MTGIGRRFDRAWQIFLAALAVLAAAMLIGPRIPNEWQERVCAANFQIGNGPIGHSLNCDSLLYMEMTRAPAKLLEKGALFQARPGLMLIASVVQAPFWPLQNAFRTAETRALVQYIDPARINDALDHGFASYAAWLAIHVASLLAAFSIFRGLLGPLPKGAEAYAPWIVGAVGGLLAANDAVRAFFWSPTPYMFFVLTPVAMVWAAQKAWRGAMANWRFAALAGLAAGMGSLCYGLWAVLAPAALGGAAARVVATRRLLWAEVRGAGLLCILTVVPQVAWVTFVRLTTGAYSASEITRWHEFIWMAPALQTGVDVLVTWWSHTFMTLVRNALSMATPVLALLALAWAACIGNAGMLFEALRSRAALIGACVFVSALIAAFYATAGLYDERLGYCLVPPIIVALGAIFLDVTARAPNDARPVLTGAAVFTLCATVAWQATKFGPFW